uniref:Uncharacterized protein LOC107462452 n=1 Tax=Rhizophora mucronata TaxID=61149 RepID=A0A2P2IXX2_RHIMU
MPLLSVRDCDSRACAGVDQGPSSRYRVVHFSYSLLIVWSSVDFFGFHLHWQFLLVELIWLCIPFEIIVEPIVRNLMS